MTTTIRTTALALLLGLAIAGPGPDRGGAWAEGAVLNGRKAPAMAFPDGVNGVTPGMTLASLRGQVVWVKFVLRDCGLCRKSLPRAQALHERWGGSGLVVLVVMHEHPPAAFEPLLRKGGYTFRVGCDPDGSRAHAWGVRRRPTDYVIGVDGRVRESNGASESVIRTELADRRVERLGEIPDALAAVREHVWNWDYGSALRLAEPAATESGGTGSVVAFAERVRTHAAEELDARLAHAGRLVARRELRPAGALYDALVRHFAGTSLADRATKARDHFLQR